MTAATFDFELQVPYKYTDALCDKIFVLIKEAEYSIGINSGMLIEPRKPPLPTYELEEDMVPKTAAIFVSISSSFVTSFVSSRLDSLSRELSMHTATVIGDPNKSFIEWIKKKVNLSKIS